MNLSDYLLTGLLVAGALAAAVLAATIPPARTGRYGSDQPRSVLKIRPVARLLYHLRLISWHALYVPRVGYRKVRVALHERRAVSA